MDMRELYRYAYIKRPLNEIYPDPSLVPEGFLLEWLKDTYDYQRLHSDEELREFLTLTPEQILTWLEEAATFVWEAKRGIVKNKKGTAIPFLSI
jgi:hypothetical protein